MKSKTKNTQASVLFAAAVSSATIFACQLVANIALALHNIPMGLYYNVMLSGLGFLASIPATLLYLHATRRENRGDADDVLSETPSERILGTRIAVSPALVPAFKQASPRTLRATGSSDSPASPKIAVRIAL